MQEFYIKKDSVLPTLRMELIEEKTVVVLNNMLYATIGENTIRKKREIIWENSILNLVN